MRRTALSWIVLFSSLALTAFAAWTAERTVSERDLVRFENAVQTTNDRIDARMQTYLALLRSGTGFFAAEAGHVSHSEFQAYVGRIDVREHYPGIQGLGYSLRLREGMRDSVVAAMRAQAFPDFTVWPAGVAGERHTIVYLDPLDERNLEAIGYDMFSDSTRREAMIRAWADGKPAITGVVQLIQEIDNPTQPGFLIYLPVYRGGVIPETPAERQELLVGYFYAPFRAGDLFNGIFGTESNPRVAFRIYDGTNLSEDFLLYDSGVAGIKPLEESEFETRKTMEVAGRTWTIVLAETGFFSSGLQRSLVPLIVFAGVAIGLILFALVRSQARAERMVWRSEQRLRTTLESLPVGVFVADSSGGITFVNSAVRRIWQDDGSIDAKRHAAFKGWWPDSGKPLRPDDWGLPRALRKETVPGQIVEIETFNGERRIILNSAFPVYGQSGRLELAVAVTIDVTEQKRAESALRERNREILLMANSIPQLAWMADERGSIFWFNERWYQYTGSTPSSAHGWGWMSLHHPDHAERVTELIEQSFSAGQEWEATFPLRGKDGEYRWFLSRAVPFHDDQGKIVRWFGTNTDITDQIKTQEVEARALREQAAREAAEAREGELRALTAELERSNRELQDFAYVASHDLQEPLRKIATFSELLRDELSDQLSEQGLHYLKRMEHAAQRMSRLIRDLLTFSRVSTHQGAFEEIDLNEALSDVILDLEWRIRESNGQIETDDLGTIEGDPTQIRQLLQNLLANALKFHKHGHDPHVHVGGHYESVPGPPGEPQTSIYQLEVTDNGIGFDQKYLDRIFTPFQRLHGRDQYEGTGMGLAITRRIVERHGGSITARSAPGEGSRFIVRLPVSVPRQSLVETDLKELGT